MIQPLIQQIEESATWYRSFLLEYQKQHPSLEKEVTVQLLSVHFHLLQNIQRHYLVCASHPHLSHRRSLRKTIVDFANVEEQYADLILQDLKDLNATLLPPPFEVELWWSYFDTHNFNQPFLRIGAALICEKISEKSKDVFTRLTHAPYLNHRNTRFFSAYHRNDALKHGSELLTSLQGARLEAHHIAELNDGAVKGFFLLERLINWAFYVHKRHPLKIAA